MTADECMKRALRQAQVRNEFRQQAEYAAIAWMAPYEARDATMDPGVVLVDEVDSGTFEHRTVEKRLHPARQVRPFNFGSAEVLSLANHIRRELRLR